MNIEKIVRIYFVFVMCVALIAITFQIPFLNQYMGSVLHIDDVGQVGESVPIGNLEDGINDSVKEIPDVLDFYFENDPAKAFANAGEKGKEIMRIHIKSFDEPVAVRYLKLKIVGIHPLAVKRAYIEKDGEHVEKATRQNEYLIFNNIGVKLGENSEEVLSVKFDLNERVKPGERMRLEIEMADDVSVFVGGRKYKFVRDFPMRGPYLSIVKKAPRYIYIYDERYSD